MEDFKCDKEKREREKERVSQTTDVKIFFFQFSSKYSKAEKDRDSIYIINTVSYRVPFLITSFDYLP